MSTLNEVSEMGRVSKIKNGLEGWREVVIRADSVLAWEVDWYPAVTGGLVTAAFLFTWYWDPTLLTFLAFVGLMATLVDYAGPRIINQVFGSDSWNGAKEKKYDQVCSEIVGCLENLEGAFTFCREARNKKPIVHFVATCASLVAMAWLGNRINNFFLAYVLTLGLMMLPGLHRRGILQKHCSQITMKMAELVKGKEALKKAE